MLVIKNGVESMSGNLAILLSTAERMLRNAHLYEHAAVLQIEEKRHTALVLGLEAVGGYYQQEEGPVRVQRAFLTALEEEYGTFTAREAIEQFVKDKGLRPGLDWDNLMAPRSYWVALSTLQWEANQCYAIIAAAAFKASFWMSR